MNLTRDQREELNVLSKEVFGTASKWKKLLERGYLETLTEEKEETVPGENGDPDTVRKVQVPKLEKGIQVRQVKHHTYESLLALLHGIKKANDDMRALWEKARKDQEAQKQVQEKAGGSAI